MKIDVLKQQLKIMALKGLAVEAVQLVCAAEQDVDQQVELLADVSGSLVYSGSEAAGIALLHHAVSLFSDNPELLFHLGTACSLINRPEDAERYLQAAARLVPESPLILANLGYVLNQLGRPAEAAKMYRLALQYDAGNETAAVGYANLLGNQNCFAQAVRVLRTAMAYSSASHQLCFCLANQLMASGEAGRALLYYLIALELNRHDKGCIDNLLYALNTVVTVDPEAIAAELRLCASNPDLSQRLNAAARPLLSLDSEFVAGMHRVYGAYQSGCSNPAGDKWASPVQAGVARRLRIGYVSADLHYHPVGFFLEGVLLNHDRAKVEVFVFSPMQVVNEMTGRLRQATEHWIVLDQADRGVAGEQIRGSAVDILFDMAGHTAGNYLDLFASRLAPIQITWGGYPSTTGIPAMDYILADRVTLPPGEERFYTEQPLLMPDPYGYVCIVPPKNAPEPGELPAIAAGHVTFGCFNGIYKYNDPLLDSWSEILKSVPDAELYLKARAFGDQELCCAFAKKFADRGVDPSRIRMEGYSPRQDLLKAYQQVDIALDPFPYQGGMTVLEAAWMGVPTVVLRGSRPPFIRHGESHLQHLGLTQWIAQSAEEYIDKAIMFSENQQALQQLRHGLRQGMQTSPLLNVSGFTTAFEGTLFELWNIYRGDKCSR
jgi:predicted O-linked N-acetylglucosamine transferase (SPINDLY family)